MPRSYIPVSDGKTHRQGRFAEGAFSYAPCGRSGIRECLLRSCMCLLRLLIPVDVKRTVIMRAKERCEYCQSRADYTTETFAVEHIIPLSRGGTDELANLALACSGCNSRKYNKIEVRDLITGATVLLFNPRLQVWTEHFSWNEDYSRIIGLTDSGRATVAVLQMNRQNVINIRYAMLYASQHQTRSFGEA